MTVLGGALNWFFDANGIGDNSSSVFFRKVGTKEHLKVFMLSNIMLNSMFFRCKNIYIYIYMSYVYLCES